jgi:hypothetical protein
MCWNYTLLYPLPAMLVASSQVPCCTNAVVDSATPQLGKSCPPNCWPNPIHTSSMYKNATVCFHLGFLLPSPSPTLNVSKHIFQIEYSTTYTFAVSTFSSADLLAAPARGGASNKSSPSLWPPSWPSYRRCPTATRDPLESV